MRIRTISNKLEKPADGNDFRGDTRFQDYADALKAGRLDLCTKLRAMHARDRQFITKCDTLERLWIREMTLYTREVQISNRERDGYRSLAQGWKKKFTREQGGVAASTLIQRGEAILKQTAKARLTHDNPGIQSDFPKPELRKN